LLPWLWIDFHWIIAGPPFPKAISPRICDPATQTTIHHERSLHRSRTTIIPIRQVISHLYTQMLDDTVHNEASHVFPHFSPGMGRNSAKYKTIPPVPISQSSWLTTVCQTQRYSQMENEMPERMLSTVLLQSACFPFCVACNRGGK